MDTHVTDSHLEIRRPAVVVYGLQIAIFFFTCWVLWLIFTSLVGMFERQNDDIILSGLYALLWCAGIALAVLLVVRFLDMLWKHALIRSKLQDAPYNYTDISFPSFGKQVEFVTADDHVVRMNIEADSPERRKFMYYHSYSLTQDH